MMPTVVMIMILMPVMTMTMPTMVMTMVILITMMMMMLNPGRCALKWTLDWQKRDSVSMTGGFLPLLEYLTPFWKILLFFWKIIYESQDTQTWNITLFTELIQGCYAQGGLRESYTHVECFSSFYEIFPQTFPFPTDEMAKSLLSISNPILVLLFRGVLHKEGESYTHVDGCNNCQCTKNGGACTKRWTLI